MMNVPGMGMPPQQNPVVVQQQQQQQQQPPQPLDNISKIKTLIGPLRESLSTTIKTAAQILNQNSQVDVGSLKGVDTQIPRFDKNLEEFYSLCDQIELHLCEGKVVSKTSRQNQIGIIKVASDPASWLLLSKTSIKALTQGESSHRYLHLLVVPTKSENVGIPNDNSLTYPQYLASVNAQVSYIKEIHDTLVAAAQNISPSD